MADASINGVNIQGMSKKEAAQTVEQKFEEDYKDTAVTDPNFFQTAACCFIKCFPDFCRYMDFTAPPRRPFPVKFLRKVSLLHCITLF